MRKWEKQGWAEEKVSCDAVANEDLADSSEIGGVGGVFTVILN